MKILHSNQHHAPVFIGGTNGSGTRLYAELLELNGVFQGNNKNYAFEPEHVLHYTKPLVPKLIKLTGSATYQIDSLPCKFRISMEKWILDVAEEIRMSCPVKYSHWGWKHPRNLFLLPLLYQVFPECYFIQVIRDGRDMAFANNKTDACVLYHDLINNKYRTSQVRSLFKSSNLEPDQYLEFWSKVNCEVADWGEQHLGSHYILSRFEDLCKQPELELQKIAKQLGLDSNHLVFGEYNNLVTPPSSIGRWKQAVLKHQKKLIDADKHGLRRFGYSS